MTVLRGNCLTQLPAIADASIQLVYLDPPFFTQKGHALRTRDNATEDSFADCWASREDYLSFMREVLLQCRRVLKNTGSIFLHCDKSASHYLRVLLDEVLGEKISKAKLFGRISVGQMPKKDYSTRIRQSIFTVRQPTSNSTRSILTIPPPPTLTKSCKRVFATNSAKWCMSAMKTAALF
jgi:hypothetical protein